MGRYDKMDFPCYLLLRTEKPIRKLSPSLSRDISKSIKTNLKKRGIISSPDFQLIIISLWAKKLLNNCLNFIFQSNRLREITISFRFSSFNLGWGGSIRGGGGLQFETLWYGFFLKEDSSLTDTSHRRHHLFCGLLAPDAALLTPQLIWGHAIPSGSASLQTAAFPSYCFYQFFGVVTNKLLLYRDQ